MDVRRIVMISCMLLAGGLGLAGWPSGSEAQGGARSVGPAPELPAPERYLIPTMHIAPATGWPAGAAPVPAPGLRVTAFATGLDHPRWLLALPNGDVLVAETNAPPRPADAEGLRGWVMKRAMKRAGAAGPSANRITLLRDADGDGVAELRSAFLSNLNSPFGMALAGNELFVANTDAVLRFPYTSGATRIDAPGRKLIDLPAGPRNHHWTKNVIASRDGRTLFVTVGSNSNAAEHGIAEETGRAAIWAVDIASGRHRLFATGLRNPNGLAFNPDSGVLWTVVNERDEMGNDLVPDFLTQVVDGGFYGWPYSYFGAHVDEKVKPQRPDLVAFALTPDYALGAHVAALGLAFSTGNSLTATFQNGAFIGQHGSWNRKPRSGYNVVFVPFRDGRPAGMPVEVLGGFVNEDGEAMGRPVGVALDPRGGLLVADDVGNTVWRVAGALTKPEAAPPVTRLEPAVPPLRSAAQHKRKQRRKGAADPEAVAASPADTEKAAVEDHEDLDAAPAIAATKKTVKKPRSKKVAAKKTAKAPAEKPAEESAADSAGATTDSAGVKADSVGATASSASASAEAASTKSARSASAAASKKASAKSGAKPAAKAIPTAATDSAPASRKP